MLINNSPDITSLDAKVLWDISGTNPKIVVTNMSTGSGLADCTWWFICKSPSDTIIHEGSELSPDITGNWTTENITNPWPRPFQQIEYSGAPYVTYVYVRDSIGNVYFIEKTATICRPFGNFPTSKNTFGLSDINVQVKCEQGRIFFQDQTNHSYKGLEGELISSTLQVMYPIDSTGSLPDPFAITNFSTALVPVTYGSDNYQFLVNSIYDYDFGNNSLVRIKYQALRRFAVWCNVDLGPLACEIAKLVDDIETGSCTDIIAAKDKLLLINPKFALVMMGVSQPLTGIDVPGLIEQIKIIGGFDCNCCEAPTGIIPISSSIIDGYSFSIVSVGGDVGGTISTSGTNIQFNLYDKSYVFAINPTTLTQTTAFTVSNETSGDGFTKTYYLNVDGTQLATDILTIISTNADLVNLFNSIVTGGSGGGTGDLVVDGGCIFDSTATCNFDLNLFNIPLNTTFALLTGIKIGTITTSLSFSFNITNLGSLQTYLNGLGLGTFTVSNLSGGNILIQTLNNSNDIQALTYKISGTSYIADLTRDCTGYTPISANQVVQNIINYLCGIDDSQIVTSQNYEICYLDSTGTSQTETITAGVALSDFLNQLMERGCTTINYIKGVKQLTCDNVKEVFVTNNLQITSTDTLMGSKGGGVCSQVSYLDAFRYMLSAGQSNSSIRDLFCQFVSLCGAGQPCAPFTYLQVFVTEFSTSCTPIVGIDFIIE